MCYINWNGKVDRYIVHDHVHKVHAYTTGLRFVQEIKIIFKYSDCFKVLELWSVHIKIW